MQLWFLSFSFFFLFFSPILSGGRLDVCHTSTHDVSSANLECRSECTRLAENTGRKNSPKIRHLRTLAELRRAIFAIKACINYRKNSLNSNISSTRPHNMVNFGRLAAEIGWQVWGTPANFNGFRVLALLLHRRRSTEVNQTLHDTFSGVLPLNGIFPGAKFTLRPSLVFSYISSI